MPVSKYVYYDFTLSLCPECLRRIEAKIIFEDEKVYMVKRCPEHGRQKVLIATDVAYYKNIRNYNKASEYPLRFNTKTHYGCPYDCGLCPDHEQHSCLSLIEVTDRCNLTCPTCYAESSPTHGHHRSLEEIERMLDVIVRNEGEPDVVQISGGEPTVHPHFFEILDLAKARPIRHLMVNTNGIRIAKDREFTRRLASYMPDFEIYLQFDSFRPEVLESMRGKDLLETRLQALAHLNEFNLSTTLVVTLQKGMNDDEIGTIIDFALKQPCVRGITFQPTQVAGRTENFDPATDRLTPTEVRQAILDQSDIFQENDLIPVPCNPDALTMAYALKVDGQVQPLTRFIDPARLLDNSRNTIVYEQDPHLHEQVLKIFSTAHSVDAIEGDMHELLCCLPQIQAPGLGYDNLFRIIIMNFMDAYDFDVRAIRKSCVHIVHPDGRIIPFETMNLFYRDAFKEAHLNYLRSELPVVNPL
ncbi:radical SAM protein [Flavilitoribacter nigricans]|uniref:Radical SAM protein n=1 Tax=Flavilitoribacter nigricans (strain ATCC 23147 / DSM 23189 / NBRC 102662 / NCIMB 1420 / SS-2) TaxID=1122177 RepID=A0A2D0NF89_FLAN2|nr:radical SAM protein [Flavilitoribacter nigricans]PHN07155.1 radical SAM protein [Flavilitoribacter nigricans DSM 23189 = NBRC 102662]